MAESAATDEPADEVAAAAEPAPADAKASTPKSQAATLRGIGNAHRAVAADAEKAATGFRRRASNLASSPYPRERAQAPAASREAAGLGLTAEAKRGAAAAAHAAAVNILAAAEGTSTGD